MAYLNWSSDLETGIAVIDSDHKILVDLLNQAYDCIGDTEESATLGSVLNTLIDYTSYHFAREERLMQAAHFPELPSHREMHQGLARKAREVRSRYVANPDSISAREVTEFLRSWLIDHILKQDFRYRPAVMANPDAVRAAEAISFGGSGGGGAVPGVVPQDDPGAATATPAAQADEDSVIRFETLSVLVVDDNQNFQVILRTILKGLGCPSITLANTGHRGLEALDSGAPGLILVDWRMEGMDGLAFVREARARGVTAPIVMISGYSEPGFEETALATGVDAFLEKPITARNLVDTVARAARGHASD